MAVARGTSIDRLRTLTRVLDDLVRIPGTRYRVGLDPLIGLVPGGGDAIGAVLSAYGLLVGARLGAPAAVLVRRCGNILLDMVVGTIPVLGDLFDFGWKANRRNLALLERYALAPARVSRRSRLLVGAVLFSFLVLLALLTVGAVFLVRGLIARLL